MTKKLTITRAQAIQECKELWEAIEASGLSKRDYLFDTVAGRRWKDKGYESDCPLCHYDTGKKGIGCTHCPLVKRYGKECTKLGYASNKLPSKQWMRAVRGL